MVWSGENVSRADFGLCSLGSFAEKKRVSCVGAISIARYLILNLPGILIHSFQLFSWLKNEHAVFGMKMFHMLNSIPKNYVLKSEIACDG
jgi:hypothetical protein